MHKGCETGPLAYSPYPRRLESLTFADVITKGALFAQLFWPWVLVRPESNSRPIHSEKTTPWKYTAPHVTSIAGFQSHAIQNKSK